MFSSFSCYFSRVCHAPKRVANSFASMSLPFDFTRLSAAGPGRRDREEFCVLQSMQKWMSRGGVLERGRKGGVGAARGQRQKAALVRV